MHKNTSPDQQSSFGPIPQLFLLPENIHHQTWLTDWAPAQNLVASSAQIISLNQERGEQSLLSVELVRELVGAASLRARRHQPTVYLLLHLERASTESQNALLKILEEPPPGLHLLLSTTDLTQVLPTITSRCFVHRTQPASALSTSSSLDSNLAQLPPEFDQFTFGFWQKLDHGQIINLIDTTLTTQVTLQKDHVADAQDETKSSLDRRVARQLILALTYHYQSLWNSLPQLQRASLLTALQLLQTAAAHLQANVNPRLVLENVFFTLKSS